MISKDEKDNPLRGGQSPPLFFLIFVMNHFRINNVHDMNKAYKRITT